MIEKLIFFSRNYCRVYSSFRLLFASKHSSKLQYETTRTNFLFSISHPIDLETRLFVHSLTDGLLIQG